VANYLIKPHDGHYALYVKGRKEPFAFAYTLSGARKWVANLEAARAAGHDVVGCREQVRREKKRREKQKAKNRKRKA